MSVIHNLSNTPYQASLITTLFVDSFYSLIKFYYCFIIVFVFRFFLFFGNKKYIRIIFVISELTTLNNNNYNSK